MNYDQWTPGEPDAAERLVLARIATVARLRGEDGWIDATPFDASVLRSLALKRLILRSGNRVAVAFAGRRHASVPAGKALRLSASEMHTVNATAPVQNVIRFRRSKDAPWPSKPRPR